MVINLDFDGTVVTHSFPYIGKDIGAIPVLKKLVDKGHKLILFTMRSDKKDKNTSTDPNIASINGDFLTQAINWFKDNDIPLYGIQTNPTQHTWTDSPKSYAEMIIDDTALGCPLLYNPELSDRPYVDWEYVESILISKGIL